MRNKLPFLLFLSLLPSIRCQSSLETHTFGGSTYKISIVTPASGSVIKFDSLDSFEIAWTGDNKQLAEEHPDLELSICLIPMEGEMDEQFQQDWEAIFSPCQTKIEGMDAIHEENTIHPLTVINSGDLWQGQLHLLQAHT